MSTTALKIIAMICMFIDHIGLYFDTPEFFHYIGRISSPIFFFCFAWGIHYTHSRKEYIKRLYIAAVLMAMANIVICMVFKVRIKNNIFATLMASGILILVIEYVVARKKNWKKILIAYVFLQIAMILLVLMLEMIFRANILFIAIAPVLGANIFLNEGGLPIVLLGVVLYYCKDNKNKLCIGYLIWCASYYLLVVSNFTLRVVYYAGKIWNRTIVEVIATIITGDSPLSSTTGRWFAPQDYRWMVVFALIFMLMYNHKKGHGWKWMFYVVYPAHLYLLNIIAAII